MQADGAPYPHFLGRYFYLTKIENSLSLSIGGRTRTRTLDPLIKSYELSLVLQSFACKICRTDRL
jgi:hypothetical protein